MADRTLRVAAASIVLAGAFITPGVAHGAKDKLRVGIISSAHNWNDIEWQVRAGVEVAAREYCGADLEIEQYDTLGTIAGSLQAVKKAEERGARVLIGFLTSSPILTINELYPNRKTPIITLMATHNDVARALPPTLQLSYDDSVQGQALADAVRAIPPKYRRKIILLTDTSSPFSTGLSKVVRETLAGTDIIHREYKYSTPLLWAKAGWDSADFKDATAIIVTGEEPELREVVSNVSPQNRAYMIVGGDGWSRASLTDYLPKDTFIPDTLQLAHWSTIKKGALSARFTKRYLATEGREPSEAAALAHDAVKLICSIKTKGKSMDFQSFINSPIEGLTGQILFRSDGKQARVRPIGSWHHDGRYELQ